MEGVKDAKTGTFYDFTSERRVILFLGSYLTLRGTYFCKLLYKIYVALSHISLAATFVLSVTTLATKSDDKAVLGQTLFTFGIIIAAFIDTLQFNLQKENLNRAANYIRQGMFTYNDGLDDIYLAIKKKRMDQLKSFISVFSYLYYGSVFQYVILGPLLKVIFVNVDASDPYINEYLPLQIFFPFNKTVWGYSMGFIVLGWTLLFIYSCLVCYVQVYLASIHHMTAEFEVLNFSIESVEKRALLQYKKGFSNITGEMKKSLYDHPEFQKCMLFCLRENIRHHHAILRFKKAVNSFMAVGSAVSVIIGSGLTASIIIIVLENPKKYIVLAMTSLATVFTYYPGSWMAELLTTMSGLTPTSLYSSPWPDCNGTFKKHINIFIQNTIQPCIIWASAPKMKVSLETFAEVTSAGYKLINVLR